MITIEGDLADKLVQSLSTNSLLASSVAIRIMEDDRFAVAVINSLPEDKLVSVLVQRLVKLEMSGGGNKPSKEYRQLMSRVEARAIDIMAQRMVNDLTLTSA